MKYVACKSLILASGFVLSVGAAWAQPPLLPTEQNEITVGATTIRWDSNFTDLNYTEGNNIDLYVTWTVVAGVAECVEFIPRNKTFTPSGTAGSFFNGSCTPTTPTDIGGSAMGTVSFDALKEIGPQGGPKAGIIKDKKGNAHLGLVVKVDTDGIDGPDLDVLLGVNVHVCDNGSIDPCPTE